jgi:hypothetical protein
VSQPKQQCKNDSGDMHVKFTKADADERVGNR